MTVPSIPIHLPDAARHAREEPRAHDWSWVWQAVSGLLVLGLVTVHMVAQHFVVPEGLRDFESVVAWLSAPVVIVVEVAFLVTVSWHGLLGLRAVLFDFGFSPRTERWITRLLVAVWIATVGYGLWLTSVIAGWT